MVHISRWARVATVLVAVALVAAMVVHASHGHEAGAGASQLHATCVVCQVGTPVATEPVTTDVATDAPICHLSIADRDHAIPPARVDVDLSRAPPVLFAS